MTRSQRSHPGAQRMFLLGVACAVLAGILGAILLNGLIYELTAGSMLGMVVTVMAVGATIALGCVSAWDFVTLIGRAMLPRRRRVAAGRPASRRRTAP